MAKNDRRAQNRQGASRLFATEHEEINTANKLEQATQNQQIRKPQVK